MFEIGDTVRYEGVVLSKLGGSVNIGGIFIDARDPGLSLVEKAEEEDYDVELTLRVSDVRVLLEFARGCAAVSIETVNRLVEACE